MSTTPNTSPSRTRVVCDCPSLVIPERAKATASEPSAGSPAASSVESASSQAFERIIQRATTTIATSDAAAREGEADHDEPAVDEQRPGRSPAGREAEAHRQRDVAEQGERVPVADRRAQARDLAVPLVEPREHLPGERPDADGAEQAREAEQQPADVPREVRADEGERRRRRTRGSRSPSSGRPRPTRRPRARTRPRARRAARRRPRRSGGLWVANSTPTRTNAAIPSHGSAADPDRGRRRSRQPPGGGPGKAATGVREPAASHSTLASGPDCAPANNNRLTQSQPGAYPRPEDSSLSPPDTPALPAPSVNSVRKRLIRVVALCALLAALAPLPVSAARAAQPATTTVACWVTLLNDLYDGTISNIYPIHCYGEAISHLPPVAQIYGSAKDDIIAAQAGRARSGSCRPGTPSSRRAASSSSKGGLTGLPRPARPGQPELVPDAAPDPRPAGDPA